MKKTALILSSLVLASCTDYWWSRGQAPSVEELLSRSDKKLNAVLENNSRKDISNFADIIKKSLLQAVENKDQTLSALESAEETFYNLEGKLSYGSRPAYGELAGQLRTFIKQAKKGEVSEKGLGLYTSRVMDFLTNELSSPGVA